MPKLKRILDKHKSHLNKDIMDSGLCFIPSSRAAGALMAKFSTRPAHRPHQEEEPTGSPTCQPLYLASVCSTNCLNIFYLIETFILILQSKIQYRNSKVQKEVSLIWTSCNNSNYSLLLWASICWWLVAEILTDAPPVIRKQDFIWEKKFLISNFEFWCKQPGGTKARRGAKFWS